MYLPLNGSLYFFLVSISSPSSSILSAKSLVGPVSLSNLILVVTTGVGKKNFLRKTHNVVMHKDYYDHICII